MNVTTVSKKKLLFVISSLTGGGAERVFVHLINHSDRSKYDILLVIFENKLDYKDDLELPVKIVCLGKTNRWHFFKIILKLRKIIAHFQPDVLISFLTYTNIVAVMASLFLRRKFKLILSERTYHRQILPKTSLRCLRKALMKFALRKADTIVTVSKSMKTPLAEDFHIRPENIICIYNPVPLEAIRAESENAVEHSFFKNENAQIIISSGRLAEQKRFDRLLRVFSTVRMKNENARLIILGKGSLRKELDDLASQLKISKWVDFVGFQSNPYAWISKADVFVLCSDCEGLPNVILEAMTCGVPVVSTDCPSGPGEIITNGKNGILVPVTDEEALAEAVLTLLKDKGLRRRFSIEGRKRAEDFRIEKILPQYHSLFEVQKEALTNEKVVIARNLHSAKKKVP